MCVQCVCVSFEDMGGKGMQIRRNYVNKVLESSASCQGKGNHVIWLRPRRHAGKWWVGS